MTDPNAAPDAHGFATFSFLMWVAAVAAFTWVEVILAPHFVPVYASLDVSLPVLTTLSLDLGCFLCEPACTLIGAGITGLTMIPFAKGNHSAIVAKRYLKGAVALLLVTGVAFYSVWTPAHRLSQHLEADEVGD